MNEYIYIYIYICVCVCVYTHTHTGSLQRLHFQQVASMIEVQ
jgi:hypothetical protein